jgi:hypothetical protein
MGFDEGVRGVKEEDEERETSVETKENEEGGDLSGDRGRLGPPTPRRSYSTENEESKDDVKRV